MTTKQAAEVVPGDRVRLASGREMEVTRIERDFLERDDLVCLVEDTDRSWFAQALLVTAAVDVVADSAEGVSG
ncbi:MAG: hypothetical protein QOI27_3068 [Gaiellaceae bacterium]|jgi:hypothetical protein|nr:hypothetical protein [Gaiellaceae bacterium]